MLLTDEIFMYGQRCQRRAYLEVYGDFRHKQPHSDYLGRIIEDSEVYRHKVLESYHAISPRSLQGSHAKKSAAVLEETEEMMRQGVPAIAFGQLIRQDDAEMTYLTQPDLLLKRPGLSRFGNWCYVPLVIKLGRRVKLDYQLLCLFHAFVLAEMQHLWPPQVGIIVKEPTFPPQPYWVSFPERLSAFQEILSSLQQILSDREEPEVFIARNRCSLCLWLNHCTQVAQTSSHLSLLPGVTPKRYATLKSLGITDLKTLTETEASVLEPLTGFGATVTRQLLQQARSTLTQQPLLHTPPDRFLPLQDPVEFYFDIESQPEPNVIYLHGVLMVQGEQRQYYPFLAESPAEEELAWKGFLDLILRYPKAPIYHFCPYEVDCIRRLGEQFRTSHKTIDKIVGRCVDLHAWVTQTVTLPVESYALKSIARWLGFSWRQEDVNGAQAICWYNDWLQTQERSFLDRIVVYNEDDCWATYHLKTWLAQFLQDCYQSHPWLMPLPAAPNLSKPAERSA